MEIQTYLFDFDDTIIDTKIYAEIYQPILDMIKKKLGLNDNQLEKKADELGLTKNRFDRWDSGDLCRELGLIEEYYTILEEKIHILPVLHNTVIEIFKKIKKQGKTIGIISNSMRRTINAYINRYELKPYLDFVFSLDDAKCKKRDEQYWKFLIKKHNLDPKRCLVIGDDPEDDVEVPKRLGFNTFLIKGPNDLKEIL